MRNMMNHIRRRGWKGGMAKLYAALINSRLMSWAESNGLRDTGQAGFREDHHCTAHDRMALAHPD